MKIRTNYVSNSSSSSFIISFDSNATISLKSQNDIEVNFKIMDFIKEIESKYESHSECTMLREKGAYAIYEEAKEWWDEESLKKLKKFLDENPDEYKANIQINYGDAFIRKYLISLIKLGVVKIYQDEDTEYNLREDF